jgi:hypothetical protein
MVSQRGGAGEAKRRDPSAVKSRRTTGLRTPVLAASGIQPLGGLQHQPVDLDQSPPMWPTSPSCRSWCVSHDFRF